MDKGGSSDADVRTFWCKKSRLFEIYGVSARTTRGREVEQVRTGGKGVDFLRTSFTDNFQVFKHAEINGNMI